MSRTPPDSGVGDERSDRSPPRRRTRSFIFKVSVLAIILFWGAMTWSLLRREVFLPRLPRPRLDSPSSRITFDSLPRDTWMGIYFDDGRKVGYSHSLIEARGDRAEDGYVVTSTTHLKLAFLSDTSEMDVDARAELSGRGAFEKFSISVDSGSGSFRAEATVVDGKTRFEVTTGGTTRRFDMDASPDALLADSMSPLFGAIKLRPGVTYRADMLDPISFVSSEARVTLVDRETILIGRDKFETDRIVIEYQGIETTAWVIDSGEVVRVDTAMGLSMVREPEEMAKDMTGGGVAAGPGDLARFSVIPVGKHISENGFVSAMKIRVTGQPLKGLDVNDHTQRLVDAATGDLSITVQGPPSDPAAYPIEKLVRSLRPFTEPELLIESDDPELVRITREIVGDAADSWKAATAIYEWVYETIEKEIVFSVPSAVEVLKHRRGDCNEHTTLFVAMSRAAGIPARIELGLVYSQGGFYYHAWPAVHVGEWVRMDPTLGQPVADATHIKFVEGGIGRWTEVLRLVGAIRIEVDEVEVDMSERDF